MAQHYVKLLPKLETYARKVVGDAPNWQQLLFDDLTEKGTRVTYESLPDGTTGPRFGISGDRFYCEAGRDAYREGDSIFVFRVESADRRGLTRVPKHYSAEFYLLDSHNWARAVDPLPEDMLGGGTLTKITAVAEPTIKQSAAPSIELQAMLRNLLPEVRQSWLPIVAQQGQATADFIEAFRRPWVRFRLDRFCSLTPRQESLVKQIVTAEIGREERKKLLAHYGIDMLNAFAVSAAPEVVSELLRALAALPLDAVFRSSLWMAMTKPLTTEETLKEIYEGLACLEIVRDIPDEEHWDKALVTILKERPDDPLFRELLDGSRDSDHPLRYLCEWIRANLKIKTTPDRALTEKVEAPSGMDAEQEHEDVGQRKTERVIETDSGSRPPAFREWLLRLQGMSDSDIQQLCRLMKEKAGELARVADDAASIPSIVELRRRVEDFQSNLASWITELPDPTRLHNDFSEASTAYDHAVSLVGDSIDSLLAGAALTPGDLIAVTRLVQEDAHLADLPEWAWSTGDESDVPHETREEQFRTLINPQMRDRVQRFVTAASEFQGRADWLLRLVPSPEDPEADSAAIEQHVREYLRDTLELVRPLPELVCNRLAVTRDRNDFAGKTRQCVALCIQLKDRVSNEVLCAAVDRLLASENESAAAQLNESIETTVDSLETAFGQASDISVAQFERAIDRAHTLPANQSAESGKMELRVEHNFVDHPRTRVPLVFYPATDLPFGFVSAPLVLSSRRRVGCTLRMEYEVTSGHREAWPSNWPNPEPAVLVIREDQWREDNEQPGRWIFTFGIKVPCKQQGRRSDFALSLRGYDESQKKRVTLPLTSLQWDNPAQTWMPMPFLWKENVDAERVVKHPIGPQRYAEKILQQIEAGGSFGVIAPRRFGKTTLVEYLLSRAEEMGYVTARLVYCPRFRSGHDFDFEAAWEFVSEELQAKLDAAIGKRLGPDRLPSEQAFDSLRKRAKELKKRGIVIVFDEAELFFPERSGHELANNLKDRLERHWSSDTATLAPVVLGFVGLPSLTDRMGGNLAGLLHPYAQHEFEEEELNKLILSVTDGSLNTTREARRRIASTAGNMYMLRDLLNSVADALNSQHRMWCNFDDVAAVESQLTADLRDGMRSQEATYIRDILNDELSVWKPNSALPLAVALAQAKAVRRAPESELFEVALQILKEWYAGLATESVTLEYGQKQFNEHLATLRERSVLQDRRFRSVLLESWLIGYERTKSQEEWSTLLFSAAIKRIRIPDSLQKGGEDQGGQAKVFRTVSGDRSLAYRVTQLEGAESRKRFAETSELLEILRERMKEGGEGSQYLFRLEEIGLSALNDTEAVQVYRWIDGLDLGEKLGQIPSSFVVDLGIKLAKAIHFLHTSNILHRDIRPNNIILKEESAEPVVIDFGFARRINQDSHTRLASEYSAPEVRCDRPTWTRSADIYSLGATLRALLNNPAADGPVHRTLAQCLLDNPAERPDATKLIRLLEIAAHELHINDRKSQIEARVSEALEEDSDKNWYVDAVRKFQGQFAAVGLGLEPTQFSRSRQASNLLNQVLEASPRRGTQKLALGLVMKVNQWTGDRLETEEVNFVHALRVSGAHGRTPRPAEILDRFPFKKDEQIKEATTAAANQIAHELGLKNLARIVGLML